MLLSIFTPTNKPEKLHVPFNSIVSQLKLDPSLKVEWVILLNNNNTEVPTDIESNSFVKVFNASKDTKNIGALKKTACSYATGDVFIELDHDDELLPGSLAVIRDNLLDKPRAFLFSDAVYLRNDNKLPLFNKKCGWEYYEFNGKPINRTFKVTARSLCEIYWAPDHVRVWTRDAYVTAGGHDENMYVGDDHDLMIRTYLTGAEFIQIPYPLYNYYIHGSNTCVVDVNEVTLQQNSNRNKYLHQLIQEWCKRENLKNINFNFNNHGSLAANSVGCISVGDVLTTVPTGASIINLMNYFYKSLVPGGWLLINVPSTDGKGAFCDPTRVSFWNDLSFRYYTDKGAAACVSGLTCKFQQVVLETYFPSEWHKKNNVPYVRSDMSALKGQTQPGMCYI